jgi:hypothetical protein
VKIVVPVVALLLGGAAWLARGGAPESVVLPRKDVQSPVRSPEELPLPATAVPAAPVADRPSEASSLPAHAVAPTDRAAQMALRRVVKLLRDALSPSEEQLAQICRILDDRGQAVAAYETEVHRRGWARLDEFEQRVGRLREAAYGRIAALLDGEQVRRFLALKPTLVAKDVIQISVPDDNVVSLD